MGTPSTAAGGGCTCTMSAGSTARVCKVGEAGQQGGHVHRRRVSDSSQPQRRPGVFFHVEHYEPHPTFELQRLAGQLHVGQGGPFFTTSHRFEGEARRLASPSPI